MLERIATRAAEIGGGLIVRRALPNRRRRTVGAWCFLDHAGPMEFGRGGGMGVGPHPHIGVQAFTWVTERAADFRNYPHLPLVELGGFGVRVLAGSALGQTSPAEVYSPLVGLDLAAAGPAGVSLPLTASFEHAALLLSGAASIEGEELTPGTLLYLGSARERLAVSCEAAARLMLVGGAPFGEEILLWWNFVARDAQEMQQAARDWSAGQ